MKRAKREETLGKIRAFRSRARTRAIRASKSTNEVSRTRLYLQFVVLLDF